MHLNERGLESVAIPRKPHYVSSDSVRGEHTISHVETRYSPLQRDS